MSKELEALERIGKLKVNGLRVVPTKAIVKDYADFYIIETALKRLEQIETTTHSVLREDISKKLKALEIIKEKRVDTLLLFRCFDLDNLYGLSHLDTYNQVLYTQNITQEEYDLLKEVLL